MIKIHKWICNTCDTKLFLRVDDSLIQDIKKLGRFENFISIHCIEKQHTVTHKEKGEFEIKYV